MVDDVQVLEHLGNSDYTILVWNLICDVGLTKNPKPIRKYHKADYKSMRAWFVLINILDKWTDYLENGGQIDVIYTDLEKAFDKVSHAHI